MTWPNKRPRKIISFITLDYTQLLPPFKKKKDNVLPSNVGSRWIGVHLSRICIRFAASAWRIYMPLYTKEAS
jgi:hypothetical protein